MSATTRIVVNVQRSETLVYMIEGTVDASHALALIESGDYEPFDSNIRSEDIDLLSISTYST
jgi:hypothetical protein